MILPRLVLTRNQQQNRLRPQVFERKFHIPLLVFGVPSCPDENWLWAVAVYTDFGLPVSPSPQIGHALIRRLQDNEQNVLKPPIVDIRLESVLSLIVSDKNESEPVIIKKHLTSTPRQLMV